MGSHGLSKTTFRFSGRFDYKEFYKTFFNIIASNGYTVIEEDFTLKDKGGDEVEVEWKFERLVDDYTKFVIKAYFLITDMVDLVVKKGDSQVNLNQGDVLVRISGNVITDYQGNWEKSPFLEKLRKFYERYLFKQTLDDYSVEVYNDVFLFEGEVKAFFELPSLS